MIYLFFMLLKVCTVWRLKCNVQVNYYYYLSQENYSFNIQYKILSTFQLYNIDILKIIII